MIVTTYIACKNICSQGCTEYQGGLRYNAFENFFVYFALQRLSDIQKA